MPRSFTMRASIVIGCMLILSTGLIQAIVVPNDTDPLREKELVLQELDVRTELTQASLLPSDLRSARDLDLLALGVEPTGAYLDQRTGRWVTLLPSDALLPGSGVGNTLSWAKAPGDDAELAELAEAAFRQYLADHQLQLRIDPNELSHVNVLVSGNIVQLLAPRAVNGVPVFRSFVNATISHGNLVLLGTARWSDVSIDTVATLASDRAIAVVREHLAGVSVDGLRTAPELLLVPIQTRGLFGDAISHRLVWVVRPDIASSHGNYEGYVDAHNGELVSFRDMNHYAMDTRRVVGGVYPKSNDGQGADGTEQPGWPMPWADIETSEGSFFTDGGGNFNAPVDGNATTTLDGRYVRIDDNCGNISESSIFHINLGVSSGDDCATPPGRSNGNTHSARSGFYELNRIAEWARGRTPDNSWLSETLEANMNINQSCNAFWSGSTVNFYRSGGGCGNTGEIAGVFDHEWGHGLDDNDNNPSISFPGEGIADLYAALRLDDSCIGRSFFENGLCNGYGDPCTECSGVRDVDFLKRQSGTPHDVAWANANCSGIVHCLGAVYAESVWDLVKRDLPNTYGMDSNTALEIGSRLTVLGASQVGDWFTQSGNGEDGCAGEGGYLNYLAADDDNGNINDGTPHMEALFSAYNRHGAACSSPTPQTSGCGGTPTEAPVVTAVGADQSVNLSWGAVAGASSYRIYRTEGVNACDLGKFFVGETTGTSFIDIDLLNNFDYFYTVSAMGPSETCLGPMSSCTNAQAAAPQPSIQVSGSCPNNVTIQVSGAAANGPIGIVTGSGGSSLLGGSACAGMPLDLTGPQILDTLTADGNGSGSITTAVDCGTNVLAVDYLNCSASDSMMP